MDPMKQQQTALRSPCPPKYLRASKLREPKDPFSFLGFNGTKCYRDNCKISLLINRGILVLATQYFAGRGDEFLSLLSNFEGFFRPRDPVILLACY